MTRKELINKINKIICKIGDDVTRLSVDIDVYKLTKKQIITSLIDLYNNDFGLYSMTIEQHKEIKNILEKEIGLKIIGV